MNIEAYNLDSLRTLVRQLEAENTELRSVLARREQKESGAESGRKNAANSFVIKENDAFDKIVRDYDVYDPDQGGRIQNQWIDENLVRRYFSRFWGRMDVYAKRSKKGGYFPQCKNRWENGKCPKQQGERVSCSDCTHCAWKPLTLEIIMQHLTGKNPDGTDAIGVYPLFPDNTCRFLVFDFDNHEKGAEQEDYANKGNEWQDEVDALRKVCQRCGVDALVERSRSGRGAHVWILFQDAVPAAEARNFGFALLDQGARMINLRSFRYYDRMYPSQNETNSIGNLIALPLQGLALQEGNTAFVDEDWNAYPDQWNKLLNTRRLKHEELQQLQNSWNLNQYGQNIVLTQGKQERIKPWRRNDAFEKKDVEGKLHLLLADGIYVDALNLHPHIQNQIRCLATIDNPEFYLQQRFGHSNYYNLSSIYLGKDIDGYIKIPRGLLETIENKCVGAGILYDIEDERESGNPIKVSFSGELRLQQQIAADEMLSCDYGILNAATAFGKTVVCSSFIAIRKVSTLILVNSVDLMDQWVNALHKFLEIDEEPPEYQTKTGRLKKRTDVIGTLRAGKDTLTGIIDVATVQSIYHDGQYHEKLETYGMVIFDECHHAASATAQQVLQHVRAKYVYGATATPLRADKLDKLNYMLIGPIRFKFTARERAEEQGIAHNVIPRFTRTVLLEPIDIHEPGGISKCFSLISKNEDRNRMILNDVRDAVSGGRTPVVLTRLKEHAKLLYDRLIAMNAANHVFLVYGDHSEKENREAIEKLHQVPENESLILIATGQKVGEGFDFPRLDTLFLAMPVAGASVLTQYVGRLNRDYPGKQDVCVYDYVDAHFPVFDSQYNKRLSAYKNIGFTVVSSLENAKTDCTDNQDAIYSANTYEPQFEQDIVAATASVVIASPKLTVRKVQRLIELMKKREEAGIKVTVITMAPYIDYGDFDDSFYRMPLIAQMKDAGINVVVDEDENDRFAVIDDHLVWHGGINLLGKEDSWDNLIRVDDAKAAAELIGMVMEESHYADSKTE